LVDDADTGEHVPLVTTVATTLLPCAAGGRKGPQNMAVFVRAKTWVVAAFCAAICLVPILSGPR